MKSAFCDVCGKKNGRLLTEDERTRWPFIARWARSACSECRRGFRRRNDEREEAAA
jgi:hypothetical protein